MRKFTKSLAAILSLTMTLSMGMPVFAEGEAAAPSQEVEATVTPTPTEAPAAQPPKNGLFTNEAGKTYYYKNGKMVKNKYGIKIKGKYYRISK